MGLVNNIDQDPFIDIYRQLKTINTNMLRLATRSTTFPLQTPQGQTFFLTPGDGTNWIDTSDGSLHWMLGGTEYKIIGTVV